jgi:transcriptional regulator with XRE-family HTH domain
MTPAADELDANREAQRALYGETLEVRLGAITRAYGVSQRRLARALGISAPMLSQLISAKRVKMGNPLAHERMAVLEQRAGEVDAPARAEEILEAVGASDIATTTQMRTDTRRTRAEDSTGRAGELAGMLGEELGEDELRAALDALSSGSAPRLRGLLETALGDRRPAGTERAD